MPASVTYWTGTWDPAKEAISKEIVALRRGSRARASVVAFSPAESFGVSFSQRVVTLPPRAWPVLRALAAAIERRGDVTHVFGGHVSWHFLRALGRRPILLSAVVPLPADVVVRLWNVSHLVVESPAAVGDWVRSGMAEAAITVVRPGVDLEHFRPTPRPIADRLTLLFASTPSEVDDIGPRGLPQLVEVARLRPDVDVVVPWRDWGRVDLARQALAALRPPANFRVTFEAVSDMRRLYAEAHATVVCFGRGVGKATPNFVLEGLAAGRPCICSNGAGFATELAGTTAGIVTSGTPEALSQGIDAVGQRWTEFSAGARDLAERRFSIGQFLSAYETLYETIGNRALAVRSLEPDRREQAGRIGA